MRSMRPKTLDDADGIPVDIVVENGIAVLQVLPLRDAVGGDQKIDIAATCFLSLRPRATGAKLSRILLKLFAPAVVRVASPATMAMLRFRLPANSLQVLEKIFGSVFERGKDQQFTVCAGRCGRWLGWRLDL